MRTLLAVVLALSIATTAAADDDGDVVASGIVKAPPEVVSPWLADLDQVILIAPDTCMRRWQVGPTTVGEGAEFRVTYLIEAWRRRLTATVSKIEPGKRVEWDHAGNRGFVTRWSFEPVAEGTKVTAHTYIIAPPRPFRRYYQNTVKPGWQACYTEMIAALDKRVTATWTPPPPEPPPAAPSPEPADEPAVPAESVEPQHP